MKNLTFNFLSYLFCPRQLLLSPSGQKICRNSESIDLMWSLMLLDKVCPLHWGDLRTH